jgi:hypothetical protein
MEGVRRWMGTHPTSSPQKIHGKPVSRADVTKVLAEPELNPHSTEAIARQLLNPVVSEEEEEEYQGCVGPEVFAPDVLMSCYCIDMLINVKN